MSGKYILSWGPSFLSYISRKLTWEDTEDRSFAVEWDDLQVFSVCLLHVESTSHPTNGGVVFELRCNMLNYITVCFLCDKLSVSDITFPRWNSMSVDVMPNEMPSTFTMHGSVIIRILLHLWASSNGGVGYMKVWWTSRDPDGTTNTCVCGNRSSKSAIFPMIRPKICSNGSSTLKCAASCSIRKCLPWNKDASWKVNPCYM